MRIRWRGGSTAKVNLASDWAATLVYPVAMADIKQSNYVGTAAIPQQDGSKTVTVGKDVPIVTFGPGDRTLAKPGAMIVIFGALPAADGSFTAKSVLIGKDGLMPPM